MTKSNWQRLRFSPTIFEQTIFDPTNLHTTACCFAAVEEHSDSLPFASARLSILPTRSPAASGLFVRLAKAWTCHVSPYAPPLHSALRAPKPFDLPPLSTTPLVASCG
jgi:hypothetical protein